MVFFFSPLPIHEVSSNVLRATFSTDKTQTNAHTPYPYIQQTLQKLWIGSETGEQPPRRKKTHFVTDC